MKLHLIALAGAGVVLSGCVAALPLVPLAVGAAGLGTAAAASKQERDETRDREAQYRNAAALVLNVRPEKFSDVQITEAGFHKEWQLRVGKTLYYCTGVGTPVHDAHCTVA